VRFHILDRDPAAAASARDLIDVDAELARHAAHRGRRRRHRQLRRCRFGGRPRAPADRDDLFRAGTRRNRARLVRGRPLLALDVLLESRLVVRNFGRGD
jgi:hypothetical protein